MLEPFSQAQRLTRKNILTRFQHFLTFCHELIISGNLAVNLKLSGVFLYQFFTTKGLGII
jgi:hypothetical protein